MDPFTTLSNHPWKIVWWFKINHLIWPKFVHCCPQRTDFSPLHVSGQQSLDLRSPVLCHSLIEGLALSQFSWQCTQVVMWSLPCNTLFNSSPVIVSVSVISPSKLKWIPVLLKISYSSTLGNVEMLLSLVKKNAGLCSQQQMSWTWLSLFIIMSALVVQSLQENNGAPSQRYLSRSCWYPQSHVKWDIFIYSFWIGSNSQYTNV